MNSATRSGVAPRPEEMLPRRRQETTRRSPAKLRCVHRWIEMQAERTPAAVALTCAGEIAHLFASSMPGPTAWPTASAPGVGPEVLVGLCAGRSAAMVVGLWPSSRRGAPTCRSTRPIPPSGSPSCSTMRGPRSS